MDLRHAHGDGNPECTRTPFVAWGSGIRKPIQREKKPPEEDTPSEWRLDNLVRQDISQIDITPLSAGLIGSNFPMNSLGIIPIDILDVSNKIKSKILFGNMMELYEIYKIKNDIQNKSITFKPYKPLINSDEQINDIQNDINNEKYEEALTKTKNFINITLNGMNYILHYDRLYLQTLVTIGYILWMIYILIFIEMKNDNNLRKFFFFTCEEKISTIVSGIITLILCIYLSLRLSPFTYYLYTLFPCYFLWRIFSNIKYLKIFFIKSNSIKSVLKNIFFFILTIFAFLSIVSQ
jgi:phosphatidylinositol glycan class N